MNNAVGNNVSLNCENNNNGNESTMRNIFSREEMALLYEKGCDYFAKMRFKMVPIDVIYRNKPKDYFDEIRQNALENGTDEIMESYEKNGSGHLECPIIGRINGLYFGTFVDSNGKPPLVSPFGEIRISVNALYLIQPQYHRLFFADFYCSRYTSDSDYHTIVLVLCVRETEEERFCQNYLVEMDIVDNPFLKIDQPKQKCYLRVNEKNDKINLFVAHKFNITNAKEAGKCSFSKMDDILGNGQAKPIGQTYDPRCKICAIREYQFHYLDVDKIDGIDKWRIWQYDCSDLPTECPCCKRETKGLLKKDVSDQSNECCPICKEMKILLNDPYNLQSSERWPLYFKLAEQCFQNKEELISALNRKSEFDLLMPSDISKKISINKQIGVGYFHQDFPPDLDNPCCHNSGIFKINLIGQKGNDELLGKFDQFFLSMFSLFNELPSDLATNIIGIFIRSAISRSAEFKDYANEQNLPLIFQMEMWYRNRKVKERLMQYINGKWVEKKLKNVAIPKENLLCCPYSK